MDFKAHWSRFALHVGRLWRVLGNDSPRFSGGIDNDQMGFKSTASVVATPAGVPPTPLQRRLSLMGTNYKRCPGCFICPKPEDIPHFWGLTPAERSEELCMKCRDNAGRITPVPMGAFMAATHRNQPHKPQGRAIVVMIAKFHEMPARFLQEYLLGNKLRDLLRLRVYNHTIYLTDGERVWGYEYFPGNRHEPLGWEDLLEAHGDRWDLYEPCETGVRTIPVEEESGEVSDSAPNFQHIMM